MQCGCVRARTVGRPSSQVAHIKAERDLLVASSECEWLVTLHFSFQGACTLSAHGHMWLSPRRADADSQNLYLAMDFIPGGDVMSLLIKYDVFSEVRTRTRTLKCSSARNKPQDITRFYIAECVLALESVHKLGYLHRYESDILTRRRRRVRTDTLRARSAT